MRDAHGRESHLRAHRAEHHDRDLLRRRFPEHARRPHCLTQNHRRPIRPDPRRLILRTFQKQRRRKEAPHGRRFITGRIASHAPPASSPWLLPIACTITISSTSVTSITSTSTSISSTTTRLAPAAAPPPPAALAPPAAPAQAQAQAPPPQPHSDKSPIANSYRHRFPLCRRPHGRPLLSLLPPLPLKIISLSHTLSSAPGRFSPTPGEAKALRAP